MYLMDIDGRWDPFQFRDPKLTFDKLRAPIAASPIREMHGRTAPASAKRCKEDQGAKAAKVVRVHTSTPYVKGRVKEPETCMYIV